MRLNRNSPIFVLVTLNSIISIYSQPAVNKHDLRKICSIFLLLFSMLGEFLRISLNIHVKFGFLLNLLWCAYDIHSKIQWIIQILHRKYDLFKAKLLTLYEFKSKRKKNIQFSMGILQRISWKNVIEPIRIWANVSKVQLNRCDPEWQMVYPSY